MNIKEYAKKNKPKLTPDEQAHFNHWEKFHLPAFEIIMAVRVKKAHIEFEEKGKKKVIEHTFNGPEVEKKIVALVMKVEKAFGGCYKCYGKGYGTQTLSAMGGRKVWKLPTVIACSCERGKAFEKMIQPMLAAMKTEATGPKLKLTANSKRFINRVLKRKGK